ncbi:MAG: endopeptidase La [Desulfobacterales bacterium]|jgi:ATP-dependent Lon protease
MLNDANPTPDNEQIVENKMDISEELPILPLTNLLAFPTLNMTLAIQAEATPLIEAAMKGDRIIGAVGIRNPGDGQSMTKQVFETGTVIRILYATRASDNTNLLVVRGLKRFRIDKWLSEKPYLKARIRLAPEITETDIETDALFRSLRDLSQEVFSLMPNIPKEAVEGLASIRDPLHLVYIAAAHVDIDFHKRQNLLEEDRLKVKLSELVAILSREKEVLALGKKIQTEAQDEMNKAQREYYLRQQLEAIKIELGENDSEKSESDEYRQRIEKSDISAEARKEALRELDRFAQMTPQSAEYSLIKTYLDWLLDLPWNQLSEDQVDIKVAREILDADHYGLQEVKDRLIEYLAVRNLLKIRGSSKSKEPKAPFSTAMGVILCFSGPPGVGKTSLGQSIARAMGREFTRMSLGGIRDEAEIRGHRRTYIGAMPGRIIQAIKRSGTRNPVFMLDEVDKIGSDWRGDPSSALLEVLDPAQNGTFRDHYLDVDFDLSDVIFIATANQLENIPAALKDRLEIIQLEGYTELEKIQIAKRHLIPRQLTGHGLIDNEMTFMDEAIRKIIGSYTREAGVRQLERLIGAVCRKCVVNLTTHGWSHVIVTPEQVTEFLKKEKFENEHSEVIDVPGVATGLAVTASGGDILYVEATRMHGDGQLNLTGQLGDVMKESAQIAYSYVRAQAEKLAIEPQAFDNRQVHLHVPAGAIPKDGPSAGIAMTMALASLFSNRPVRSDLGMTGEITLRGRILPVGGIKMKLLAAHRAGLKTVILPKRNARDLDDVPEEIRNAMQFILVDRIDEAIDIGLTRSENGARGDYRPIDRNMNPLNEEISALNYPIR